MATMMKFEEILSWQEARKLNISIGKMIDEKKMGNNFRLINQMEGAAGSIMDNIAEGFARNGNREFIQFLYIAKGSCGELRSQLYRALDRNYINNDEFEQFRLHTLRISSLLQKLISYLNNTEMKGVKYKNRNKTATTDETSGTLGTSKTSGTIEPLKPLEPLEPF